MRELAIAVAVTIGVAATLGGCTTRTSPPPAPEPAAPERVPLEPAASPLPFRWLSDEAVLVEPKTGARELAKFGNFVDRSARPLERARLAVWDDEAAWRRSRAEGGTEPAALAHKRAEFLKDAGAAPVEEFTVFDADGGVVYERDFRDWPLTATDE